MIGGTNLVIGLYNFQRQAPSVAATNQQKWVLSSGGLPNDTTGMNCYDTMSNMQGTSDSATVYTPLTTDDSNPSCCKPLSEHSDKYRNNKRSTTDTTMHLLPSMHNPEQTRNINAKRNIKCIADTAKTTPDELKILASKGALVLLGSKPFWQL